MRVSDGGGGWPGQGFSGGSRASDFRRAHRVGQTVRGVALRPEPAGSGQAPAAHLAWLRIDGQELLADVGRPVAPGEVMLFRIEALEPDIVLRELRGGGNGGPSLMQLAPAFRAERDRFEALLSMAADWPETVLSAPDHKAVSHRESFNALLDRDSGLMEAYRRVLGQELALDAGLRGDPPPGFSREHGLRFAYCPWLLPGFRECELLAWAMPSTAGDGQAMRELRLAFDSPHVGPGELRLLLKPPRAGYRIHLAAPQTGRMPTALQACAQTLARDAPADFLGVFRLDGPTGLAMLLGSDASASRGRRV